ncbi:MAG TPA: 4-(cytidine 5'-diphospho)-2-C-methyl-D-erythritol kinase [Methylomirabilota bacterium]|nr:4-(cytidine 5'-diphospho)-2-C-methyl-D-erythritol kinase [Methylomirabilota bacterium]
MLACRVLSKGSGNARRLVVSAAAKVNLALEVLGRRADGYHEIATVMQTVDLSDRLVLEEADGLELRTTAPDIPTDERNLAYRAAAALREAGGIEAGARLTLDKRIPAAAGLGGGSSDAAAALLGLNRLWGLRWPAERLDELAVGLGMDVPFFLRGGAALATGRGERLAPLAGASLALVLVNPRFGVSTAEMYGRLTSAMYTDGARARAVAGALNGRGMSRLASSLYNGMEAAARAAYPEIGQMQAALMAAGALAAMMSGSGPTVFGVARSREQARQIQRRITRGSWQCWAVRTLRGPAIRIRDGGTG